MAEFNWYYEKLNENLEPQTCPQDDKEGTLTGLPRLNVPRWFDENPAERIRLGWTKHITHDTDKIDYDRQTQYLIKSVKQIDEYTVEDEYQIMTKSEEQLRFEEMLDVATGGSMFSFF